MKTVLWIAAALVNFGMIGGVIYFKVAGEHGRLQLLFVWPTLVGMVSFVIIVLGYGFREVLRKMDP